MDILQRLYRIARAQIDSDEPVAPPLAGAPSAGGAAEDPAPAGPPQDPELARCYANLEIPYGSDLETARRAWKRLLKKYHPDLHAGDPQKRQVADRLTAELTLAFRHLENHLKDKETL